MSVVLVTGGTGGLGSKLVPLLRARGDDVRVLSRSSAGTHRGDLTSGVGIGDAVAGAELIVHAGSDTRRLGKADLAQTRHLLGAATAAGCRHLLFISIVGVDDHPFPYYRRKLRCEQEISASGLPHTVLRATQFHELLAMLLRVAERLPVAPLPTVLPFQPVAAEEVAERIAELIHGDPAGRAEDFGGPEVLTLGAMTQTWRAHRGRPRRTVPLRVPGRSYRAFRAGRHTCPDHAAGHQTWADFVSALPARERGVT
ncbi:MAG TPA: NAD(P)H-binding protein [Mycobacteriales bacterium]|nr:NAD(P)H-binding protein [Mycobacteriales bacterium]